MGEDERSARKVEHVELDQVDAVLDRGAKGAERVLGREMGRAAMTDPEHGAPGLRRSSITRSPRVPRGATTTRGPPATTAWADCDRRRESGDVDPELLRVHADQRVGVREAPRVALEEHLVEAGEEGVEPEHDDRHREDGNASVASAPTSRPAGHDRPRSRVRESPGRAQAREDEQHDELCTERQPEDAADVPHVRELALVERARAVRKPRLLEQLDAGRAGADRLQPAERERLPLLRRQAVRVGLEATELPAGERLRREHTQRVDDEGRGHDERDRDDEEHRYDARRRRYALQRGSLAPRDRTGARSRARSSTRAGRWPPRAARARPRTAHPLALSGAECSTRARRRARWR